jgi:1-phosphofructokinase
MIVTVTCNPALDKTATLAELRVGELNRLLTVEADAAGKGINVSKTLAALGEPTVATGFIGGSVGAEIARRVAATPGVTPDFIAVGGEARTNLKIMVGAELTELNEPAIAVTPAEAAALVEKVLACARQGAVIVLSGSLCAGVGPGFYGDLVRQIHEAGSRAVLDADGEALLRGVEAEPDLMKPNRFELLQLAEGLGQLVPDGPGDGVTVEVLALLAGRLASPRRGPDGESHPRTVAVSLGGEGALFVRSGEATLYAPALDVPVRSTVGAGDAVTSGLLYGLVHDHSWEDSCRLAMACAAGAVMTVGTKPPGRDLVDSLQPRVRFTHLT